MKVALVPAAGRGTRLGRVGAAVHKALVPFDGRPAIDHILEMLRNAGVLSVYLIVGYKKEQLISYVEDGADFGLKVAYITQPHQKGIANALLQSESFVHDDFLCLLGDTLLNPSSSVKDLAEYHIRRNATATLLVTHVNDVRGYGVIEPSGDEVRRVVEKPATEKEAPSSLAMVGCYSFSPKIFEAANRTAPNKRTGEIELSDAIQNLIDEGERVCYVRFDGTYIDTGKLSSNVERDARNQ